MTEYDTPLASIQEELAKHGFKCSKAVARQILGAIGWREDDYEYAYATSIPQGVGEEMISVRTYPTKDEAFLARREHAPEENYEIWARRRAGVWHRLYEEDYDELPAHITDRSSQPDIVWESENAAALSEKDTSYVVEFSTTDRPAHQEWSVYGHYPDPEEAVARADSMLTQQNIDATRVRKIIA